MFTNTHNDEETGISAPDNTHMRPSTIVRLTHGLGAKRLVFCTHMCLTHGFVHPKHAKNGLDDFCYYYVDKPQFLAQLQVKTLPVNTTPLIHNFSF